MLKKQLDALSNREKAEVVDRLPPASLSADGEISPGLLAELERRDEAYAKNPVAYTIEEIEAKLLALRPRV